MRNKSICYCFTCLFFKVDVVRRTEYGLRSQISLSSYPSLSELELMTLYKWSFISLCVKEKGLWYSNERQRKNIMHIIKFFKFIDLRESRRAERGEERLICCCSHWRIHWLILLCALIGVWIHNLGVSRQCSNQLSYPARAMMYIINARYPPQCAWHHHLNSKNAFFQDPFLSD